MTQAEKAKELVGKFQFIYVEPMYLSSAKKHSKECALIAVDEIILAIPEAVLASNSPYNHELRYWQQVKQEIEKL